MDDAVSGGTLARPGQRARIIEHLRSYSGGYVELSRHGARWMGLHVRDTEALSEVIWAEDGGRPLSPARLSEKVGLTSGATNALVNRLEEAGHLSRHREGPDRRIVTLRSTPTARARAAAFTGEPVRQLDAVLDHLGPEALDAVEAAVEELAKTLANINQKLAQHSPGASATESMREAD